MTTAPAPRTMDDLMALGEGEAMKVLLGRGATDLIAKKLITAYKLEKVYREMGEWMFLEGLMVMFEAQGCKAKLSVRWPEREALAKRVVGKKRRR